MKKELKNKKLSLGKMTVAKLQISQQQMRFFNGGNDTIEPKDKTTVTQPTADLTFSLVELTINDPCGTPKTPRASTPCA
jgi:hypothetical protein